MYRPAMLDQFNQTLAFWITALESYTYEQLCLQPNPESWSLGQVYIHLLEETTYYLQQSEACLTTTEHASESMTEAAKVMFQQNSFPNEKIQGYATVSNVSQPESKAHVRAAFLELKRMGNKLATNIATHEPAGKTKHPGLGYFNAAEWLQFAEMHLRHHQRQKEWIDAFLQ